MHTICPCRCCTMLLFFFFLLFSNLSHSHSHSPSLRHRIHFRKLGRDTAHRLVSNLLFLLTRSIHSARYISAGGWSMVVSSTRTHAHAHVCTRIHASTHPRIHARTHTRTHVRTRTHAHARTYALAHITQTTTKQSITHTINHALATRAG